MDYDENNIFAKILRGEAPAHKVYEDDATIAFLDVMPQSEGHTLVLPKARAVDLFNLDDASAYAVMKTVRHVARAVDTAFEPDGIRIMQFNRPAAGQSVFHFHMHIVPCYEDRPARRHGDRMEGPEKLDEHAQKLRAALEDL